MAWTNPTTWTASQLVTAADLNAQVRDNLLHVAGSAGFTGATSSAVGIQPAAGYFAGAVVQNYHLEAGSFSATTNAAGTVVNFVRGFVGTPVVVLTPYFSTTNATVLISATSSGFVVWAATTTTTGRYIAWGADT